MADQTTRMSKRERHLLGFDHTPNKAHGETISGATVTLTDEYGGANMSSSLLSAATVAGLKVSVLVGDFPKKGRYRLSFLCTIGSERFEDDIVINVED